MSNHIKALEAEVEYLRRLVRLAYAEGFEDGRYAAEDCRVPSDPKKPSERTEAMDKILAEFWEASESKKTLSSTLEDPINGSYPWDPPSRRAQEA